METRGGDRVVLQPDERPDRGVEWPRQRGRDWLARRAACGQPQRDQQIVDQAAPAAGRVAGARIGAADVRAERAGQPVWIGVVEKTVAHRVVRFDTRDRSAYAE